MGLDATVNCDCFRRGLIISPFPAHTVMDEDGELTLDFPEDGHEEEYARFRAWLDSGPVCEHPGMEYLSLRISNWGGVSSFKAALEDAGWELFPTLRAYLPANNGGQVPVSAASAALEELQTFKDCYVGIIPALVNVETGDLVRDAGCFYSVSGGYSEGVAGHIMGMDREGVFVEVNTPPPARSFRSMHFVQEAVPKDEVDSRTRYEFVFRDVASGESCVIPHFDTEHPQASDMWIEMRVELRQLRADYFTFILRTLEQVLQAARDTGNPVRWW